MPKTITLLLSLGAFFLAVFQNSYLAHFTFRGSGLNLILILIFFIAFFEKNESKSSVIISLVGGLTMDIFSSYLFGIFTLSALIFLIAVKKINLFLEKNRTLNFVFLLFVSLLIYFFTQMIIMGLFNGFYFDVFGVLYSFIFGLLIYLLRLLIYVPVYKKFE